MALAERHHLSECEDGHPCHVRVEVASRAWAGTDVAGNAPWAGTVGGVPRRHWCDIVGCISREKRARAADAIAAEAVGGGGEEVA